VAAAGAFVSNSKKTATSLPCAMIFADLFQLEPNAGLTSARHVDLKGA
jgi:hypothetical protein